MYSLRSVFPTNNNHTDSDQEIYEATVLEVKPVGQIPLLIEKFAILAKAMSCVK